MAITPPQFPNDTDPNEVMSLWDQISKHQKFTSLGPQEQSAFRQQFFRQNVLGNNAFKQYGREKPQDMENFSRAFFAPETQAIAKMAGRAQAVQDLYPQTFAEHFTKSPIPMALNAAGLPTSMDIPEEHYIARGVAHVAENLLTPVNTALGAATAGAGGVLGEGGTLFGQSVKGLGLSARAVRGVQAAASTGFAAQMGEGTIESAEQIKALHRLASQAEAAGDHEAAGHYRNLRNQAIVEGTANLGMFAASAKHGYTEGKSAYLDNPTFEEAQKLRNLGYADPNNFSVNDAARAIKGRFVTPYAPAPAEYPEPTKAQKATDQLGTLSQIETALNQVTGTGTMKRVELRKMEKLLGLDELKYHNLTDDQQQALQSIEPGARTDLMFNMFVRDRIGERLKGLRDEAIKRATPETPTPSPAGTIHATQLEDVAQTVGKGAAVDLLKKAVKDRTDLAPDQQAELYIRALATYILTPEGEGASPLDAATKLINEKSQINPQDTKTEAGTPPVGAATAAPQQPLAQGPEKVNTPVTTDLNPADELAAKKAISDAIRANASLTGPQRMSLAKQYINRYRDLVHSGHENPLGEVMRHLNPKEFGMPALNFRSKAEELARNEPRIPEKASGDQMLRSLVNAGVSPEEIKWTGLDTFLREKGKTSKSEVAEYLANNRVTIEEISKSETNAQTPLAQEYARHRERAGALAAHLYTAINDIDQQINHEEYGPAHAAKWRLRIENHMEFREPDSDFASLTELPRNVAPRSLTLHKLLLEVADAQKELKEHDAWIQANAGDVFTDLPTYEQYTLPGGSNYREVLFQRPMSEAAVRVDSANRAGRPGAPEDIDEWKGVYRGPHFNELNVLAHVRLKDRVTPDGKKVLFVEEVQSDWHQHGKGSGYAVPGALDAATEELHSKRNEIAKHWNGAKQYISELPDLLRTALERITGTQFRPESGFEPARTRTALGLLEHPSELRATAYHKKIGSLDHISDTDMAHFADGLRSYVERANDATDLEQELESKFYRLQGAPPDAPFKSNWHELVMRRVLQMATEGGYDKVAWTTGEQQAARYGEHIQGEAHGFLYDTVIPQYLNKFGKRFGARVGTTDIETRPGVMAPKPEGGFAYEGNETAKVHSLDITPELRAAPQVKRPYTFGMPSRETRFEQHREISQVLERAAQKSVETSGMDLHYEGSMDGLTYYTDPVTGSTLAQEHREAASGPESVRAHVLESRAKFERYAAAKAKGASAMPERWIDRIPGTLRPILKRMPGLTNALFDMTPDRAIRILAANVNPALRDAMLVAKTDLFAGTYDSMRELGLYKPMNETSRAAIKVRARGKLERWLLNNELTMDQVAAHEFGHRLFDKYGPTLRSGLNLYKFYPKAVDEVVKLYGDRWDGLTEYERQHERFANAFAHYYMGLEGDSAGFARALNNLPTSVRATAMALEGQGSMFESPHGAYRLSDLQYRSAIGIPNMGMPPRNPIASLGRALSDEEVAKVTGRKYTGELRRDKVALDYQLRGWIKKFSGYGLNDYLNFMDIADDRTGQTSLAAMAPEDRNIVSQLRDMVKERRDIIEQQGYADTTNWVNEYWPRLFKGQTGNTALARIMGTRAPLAGSKRFMKATSHPTAREAVLNGAEPITYNPVEHMLATLYEMDKYIKANEWKLELKDKGVTEWYKGSTPGRHQGVPADWVRINDSIFNPWRKTASGELAPAGAWYAHKDAAKIINNYLAPGLRGNRVFDAVREYGNTLNQAQLAWSGFHLAFEAINTSMNDLALGMDKTFHLSGGQTLDGLKLMGRAFIPLASFAHQYRLGDLIKSEYRDAGSNPHLTNLTNWLSEAGGAVEQDPFWRQDGIKQMKRAWKDANFSTGKGVASYASLFPKAFKAFNEGSSYLVMDHIVPRLKAGAFADLASAKLRDLDARGITDRTYIAQEMDKVWDSIDNRMGQLVYDNLHWNRTVKDLAMLSVRSVGWNIGTFREAVGTTGNPGALLDTLQFLRGKGAFTPKMAYMVALPIIAGYYGAMYQTLRTGQWPQKPLDYFYPQTGEAAVGGKPERVAVPSYMKDVFSYEHSVTGTLVNKLHPAIQQMYQLWTNKDFYGTEIVHPGDSFFDKRMAQVKYLGRQLAPGSLAFENYQRRKEATGSAFEGGFESFMGITPAPAYVGSTPAEDLAYQLTYHSNVQTPAQAEHYHNVDKIRNLYATGKLKDEELDSALEKGLITGKDLNRIVEESNESPLVRHFKSPTITLPDALNIYRISNEQERVELQPYMYKKLNSLEKYPEPQQEELEKEFEELVK